MHTFSMLDFPESALVTEVIAHGHSPGLTRSCSRWYEEHYPSWMLHVPHPGDVNKRGPWHQRPVWCLTRRERRRLRRRSASAAVRLNTPAEAQRLADDLREDLQRHAMGMLETHRGALLLMAPGQFFAAHENRTATGAQRKAAREAVRACKVEVTCHDAAGPKVHCGRRMQEGASLWLCLNCGTEVQK